MLRKLEHKSAEGNVGTEGHTRPESPDGSQSQVRGGLRRSRASRVLNAVVETVLFALAAVVIVGAVGPIAGLWHYEVIESASMTPALRVGGVAIVVPEPVSDVRIGQVIAYHPPGMPKYARIHRVVQITHRGTSVWVRTKGDANPIADPGPVRLEGKVAYVEKAFVPYVGYAGIWLYKQSTRTALEGVMLALMVGGGLWLIWGSGTKSEDTSAEAEDLKARSVEDTPGIEHAPSAEHPPAKASVDLSATAEVIAPRPPLARRAKDGAAPNEEPHVAAEKAATATLVALNNIYSADNPAAEGGEVSAAKRSVPRRANSRR